MEPRLPGAALSGQQLLLVGVQVQAVVFALAGHGLIAAVAGDELRPSAKVLMVSWQWLPQPPH